MTFFFFLFLFRDDKKYNFYIFFSEMTRNTIFTFFFSEMTRNTWSCSSGHSRMLMWICSKSDILPWTSRRSGKAERQEAISKININAVMLSCTNYTNKKFKCLFLFSYQNIDLITIFNALFMQFRLV